MPKYTIKAGNHYHSFPPFSSLPWIGKRTITRTVTFDENCRYDSAPYNSQDVNKLFGLSFGLQGNHWNSARFGWRWSNSDQCIELLAYVYNEGVKNWDAQLRFPVVAQVKPGVELILEITYDSHASEYAFWVTGPAKHIDRPLFVPAPASLPSFGLTAGFYFGGELTAPHTMSVTINR